MICLSFVLASEDEGFTNTWAEKVVSISLKVNVTIGWSFLATMLPQKWTLCHTYSRWLGSSTRIFWNELTNKRVNRIEFPEIRAITWKRFEWIFLNLSRPIQRILYVKLKRHRQKNIWVKIKQNMEANPKCPSYACGDHKPKVCVKTVYM